MRLDHIIVSVLRILNFVSFFQCGMAQGGIFPRLPHPVLYCLLMPGGHSGEAIPVPIPNTEVKLSNADDTASQRESR